MSTLIAIIKMLPAIIQLINALESTMGQSGTGPARLAIAQEVLSATYDETSDISKEMPKDKWLAIATGLITKFVGIFNGHGIFKGVSAQK